MSGSLSKGKWLTFWPYFNPVSRKKKKSWLEISLNCCMAKFVWRIETLFEFVKNENFIKKCQKVCSIHSIRKVTFYCGCCIFLKYCQSVEEHSVCCYQDASTDTLFRVLFLDRPVDFSLMHFKYTPRYVTVWNIDCVMKQIKLKWWKRKFLLIF